MQVGRQIGYLVGLAEQGLVQEKGRERVSIAEVIGGRGVRGVESRHVVQAC